MIDLDNELDDCVETAAQLIHEQRHRMGYAQVCARCRQLAAQILDLYRSTAAQRPQRLDSCGSAVNRDVTDF